MSVIDTLFAGRAAPLARDGYPPVASGIVKTAQAGPLWLSTNGLQGDEQGDPVYHGGPEKAVHHYPVEHYAWWQACHAASPVALVAGAFGENVSTQGMTENTVCIGDIWRAGTAILQVSQGRQPCWKLNRLLRTEGAALAMQVSGATGWYYRVLREGWLAPGDRFELIGRPCPDWPLRRLIAALFPADPQAPGLAQEWQDAAAIEALTANWRAAFARRVQTGALEDWSRRLHEPAHPAESIWQPPRN